MFVLVVMMIMLVVMVMLMLCERKYLCHLCKLWDLSLSSLRAKLKKAQKQGLIYPLKTQNLHQFIINRQCKAFISFFRLSKTRHNSSSLFTAHLIECSLIFCSARRVFHKNSPAHFPSGVTFKSLFPEAENS